MYLIPYLSLISSLRTFRSAGEDFICMRCHKPEGDCSEVVFLLGLMGFVRLLVFHTGYYILETESVPIFW
jgi:hypothetical protein